MGCNLKTGGLTEYGVILIGSNHCTYKSVLFFTSLCLCMSLVMTWIENIVKMFIIPTGMYRD